MMAISSPDQHARGTALRKLHTDGETFVIPNPWDAGSARILQQLGFSALTTTSGGLATSLGYQDGGMNLISRAEILRNTAEIVEATTLPVAVDLENGYAHSADGVAETIRLASEAGAVGASIEDVRDDRDDRFYPIDVAADRVAAAAKAAASLDFPFTLVGRAENFLYGRNDVDDTIERLRAYSQAGADVLYAPCLPDLDTVGRVCSAVDKPVNVLVTNPEWTVAQLADAGVARISLGTHLSNAAFGAAMRAAREIREKGSFSFTGNADANSVASFMNARR